MEEAVELSIPHIYKHELRFVHNGKWVSIFHPRDKMSRILMKSRYVFGDSDYTNRHITLQKNYIQDLMKYQRTIKEITYGGKINGHRMKIAALTCL